MHTAMARAARFRHVVFPDSVGALARAVDAAAAERAARADVAERPPAPPQVPPVRLSLTHDEEAFLAGLGARVGVSMRHYKPETLCRRLPACLRAIRAESVAHARRILQRDPRLDAVAAGALIIGVTSFFRDAQVFDALADSVLPRLLARRAGRRDARLRVWSAGCSDGAELYSVAILLDELGALAPDPGQRHSDLTGTDCRPDAVARAAAGTFDAAAVRGVSPERIERCFERQPTPDGTRYTLAPRLRAAASWGVGDVLAPEPGRLPGGASGPLDLILCRNLVIYLRPAATSALWASLARALRPGGVLVLGKAERPLGVPGLVPIGPCLYRKGDA